MLKVLFMGAPGAGKGAQSHLLEEIGFEHISVGKIIRKSTDPTIVAYRAEKYARGELLDDDVILKILREEIENLPKNIKGYVLDGAGRTLVQAKYLKENELIDIVIFFDVSKSVATRRLLNRNEGRTDDNPEAIQKRFDEYEKKTKPALDYFRENTDFHEVDAERSIEEIHEEVLDILGLE